MSYTLTMSGVIVGRSELENRDASRGVASGAFRPGMGYELVQPIFGLYEQAGDNADALARYRKSRDALKLQVADSLGGRVAVRELHIHHVSNALVLVIETEDPSFWNSPRPHSNS